MQPLLLECRKSDSKIAGGSVPNHSLPNHAPGTRPHTHSLPRALGRRGNGPLESDRAVGDLSETRWPGYLPSPQLSFHRRPRRVPGRSPGASETDNRHIAKFFFFVL